MINKRDMLRDEKHVPIIIFMLHFHVLIASCKTLLERDADVGRIYATLMTLQGTPLQLDTLVFLES